MALCCLGRLSRTLECSLLDFKLWNGALFECKQRCHTMTPPCLTCAYDIRCMIYNVCAWQSAGNFFLFYCWLSYVHKCCLLLVDASNIWHVMPRSKVLNDLYFEWKALQASCQLQKNVLSLSWEATGCIHVIHAMVIALCYIIHFYHKRDI